LDHRGCIDRRGAALLPSLSASACRARTRRAASVCRYNGVMPLSRPVTIMDVAREAGVSYSTVSRVVNNKHYIVPDKRARVLEAIDRLGYAPNLQARKLAGG